MKEIVVDSTTILVDDEDAERVLDKPWRKTESNHFYISWRKRRRRMSVSLQRFVVNYDGPLEVAHKDGNPFNFQKQNLVPMSHRDNMQQVKNNTSGHPGVYMQTKQKKPWCANIWLNGKNTHIGSFPTFEEAKNARINYVSFLRQEGSI